MNTLPKPGSQCRLTRDFHLDLAWWIQFLEVFNGKCDFLDHRPVTTLQTDACPEAMGAFFDVDWMYSNFFVDLPKLAGLHINFKEALCVVFAAIRWGASWSNKTVHIYCDNTAAVAMLTKGTTKNRD